MNRWGRGFKQVEEDKNMISIWADIFNDIAKSHITSSKRWNNSRPKGMSNLYVEGWFQVWKEEALKKGKNQFPNSKRWGSRHRRFRRIVETRCEWIQIKLQSLTLKSIIGLVITDKG